MSEQTWSHRLNIHRLGVSTHTEDMVRRYAAVTAQVGLLWFMSWLGHQLVAFLHLPMPGNVAGLLLTFLALTSGVLPIRFVEPAAALLVRNLPVFFVPLAIGFVTQGRLIAAHAFAVLAILVVSAAVGFAVTGRVAQFVSGLKRNRSHRGPPC
jgi:holin-like protein